MQRRQKSKRHQLAADARWRAAAQRAQAERDAGIPDRLARTDTRQPITIDLSSYGGPCVRIEPRLGYISVRAIREDGSVTACALKTLLHSIADQLPRTAGARSIGGMA